MKTTHMIIDQGLRTLRRAWVALCVALAATLLSMEPLTLFIDQAHATGQTSTIWPSFRFGTVYTRNAVRGPNGERIFAEFGTDGQVVREIGEAVGQYENAVVMSGAAYRSAVQAYNQLQTDLGETDAQGAYVLSRAAYEGTNFTTLGGAAVTNKPALYSGTKSVVVRHATKLLTPGTSPILLESRIDLQNRQELSESIQSVLLTPGGQVLVTSEHNIGYRTAFMKPAGGTAGECSPAYGPEEDNRKYRRVGQDDACGPVAGALVTTDVFPGREGGAMSEPDGQYHISYMMLPCPGFDIEYTHYIIPKLYYTAFNPKGQRRPGMYYQVSPAYDWCFGFHENLRNATTLTGQMAYLNAQSIIAALPEPSRRFDIGIDVMALTGVGRLANSAAEADTIPLGQTRYTTDLPTFTPGNPDGLDLDGDRNEDTVLDLAGVNVVDAGGTAVTVEPNSVAVYLGDKQPQYDSNGNLLNSYDLLRKKDTAPDTEHQGLLSELSAEDLEETDLYVYRTSNDQLIFERKGLDPDEDQRGQGGGTLEGAEAGFYYYSVLRGPYGHGTYFNKDFATWQADSGMNPDLHVREADHLRVGETIKVVAVNRRTGYIGTATAQVGNAAQNASGRIDFPIPDIVMRPPNLRIKAERNYDVQAGLTKDEEREYLIGFEGSGLASDRVISISTEWLDHDGAPLPADLPGYTARLAKIVGDRTLGDNLAEFEITPGTHLQLIRLPDDAVLSNDHFYVHVAGSPPEDSPNFSSTGAGEGVLASRPRHYVPILVPVLDEVETRARRNQQRYAREDGTLGDDEPRAEAVYAWVYRPEMQFSVLDLTVQALNRTDSEGNTVDVYPAGTDASNDTIPGFTSSDQYAQLLYNLLMGGYAPLDPLGYTDPNRTTLDPENVTGREYVFAFGEDEVYATFGEDQSATFNNVGHLAALDVDDYLTIRLIQNNDAENVLWEFAFYAATLISDEPIDADGVIEVSADTVSSSPITLYGALLNVEPDSSTVFRAQWNVVGSGSMSPAAQASAEGIFSSDLLLPTTVGSTATVKLNFGAASPLELSSAEYEVVAGEPSFVQVAQSGETGIGGLAAVAFDITVRDAFGNLVSDGTAVQIDAPDLRVEGSLQTVGGHVQAQLFGIGSAGTKNVEVTAGDVTIVESVEVADIDVTITMPFEIEVGSTASVQVSVGSSYSSLDGLPVSVSSFRGDIRQKDHVAQNGQVSTEIYVGDFRGEGKVYVLIAETVYEHVFNVVEPQGEPRVLDPVIISDTAAPGQFTAGGRQFQYTNQTYVAVTGTPGETVEASLVNYLEPPFIPTLEFSMANAPTAGRVRDIRRGHEGEVSNVVFQSTPTPTSQGAYRFSGDSSIDVPADSSLVKQGGVGITGQFNAQGLTGTIAQYRAAGLTLSLNNNQLVFRQSTDVGESSVVSGVLTADVWYRFGAHVIDNQLVLQVDGETFTAPLVGTPVAQTGGIALRIGENYSGLLAGIALYNWDEPSALQLGNGLLVQATTIPAEGRVMIPVRSNPAAVLAAREERESRLNRRYAGFFVSSAQAAVADECQNFVVDDISVYSAGEAFLKFVVDCKLQERISAAKLKINHAGTVYEKTVAYMELAAYQMAYSQLYLTSEAIGYLPDCLDGAVTGDADTGAGAVCDLITSLFLIGDLRDFVIHGYFYFTDAQGPNGEARFDKPVFVFATLGIVTTLAEVSGIGVVLDAAVAGCKVSAKVLRGPMMTHLANYVERRVLKVPVSQMDDAARVVLPMMQVVALVGFYGEDLASFVSAAIQSEADFDAWRDYLYFFSNHPENAQATAQNGWSPFEWLISSATAAISDDLVNTLTTPAIGRFIEMLRRVDQSAVLLRSERTLIGQAFTQAIKELQELQRLGAGSNEVRAVLHKSATIRAMTIVHLFGGEDAVKALRQFPCVPSNCGMGASMEVFMERIVDLENLVDHGRLTNLAQQKLEDVFQQLGQLIKKADSANHGQPNLNVARGAVGVLSILKRLSDEGKVIDDFEVYELVHAAGGNISRRMDIRASDGTLYEIKGWTSVDLARDRLLGPLEGGVRKKGFLSSQLFADIVKQRRNPEGGNRFWRFSDERLDDPAERLNMADEVVAKIRGDRNLQAKLSLAIGLKGREERSAFFAEQGPLESVVRKLFGVM